MILFLIIFLFFSRFAVSNLMLQYKVSNLFDFSCHLKNPGCVSFMLPVYNKAKYLNRSIGSILGQNHQCIEIIAINDGSTDNSKDILKYWMKKDRRVIVHAFEKNRGLVAARIQGVLLSFYNYVHPMDPDDELPKNCLGGFISYALQTNCDMVMGRVQAKYSKGIGNWNYKMVREYMNRTQMLSRFRGCSMNWNLFRLFKRNVFLPAVELLLNKFYLPILYAEDKLFMGTILLFANNYSYYSKPTYIYYYSLPDNSRSGFYNMKKYSNSQSSALVSAFLRIIHPNFRC